MAASECSAVRRASPESAGGDVPFDASIVICTRDRCASLANSLACIGAATVPRGWLVELVVVDNGSSDETRALLDTTSLPNMPVRYVFEPRTGKGFAYNAGLEAARGAVLLLTDDDTRVPGDWIEQMCRPILAGEADAVQGGVRIAAHLERPWLKGVLRGWVAEVADPAVAPAGLVGANMAFSRGAMLKAGPFDTSLGPGAAGFYDDTVFGWRLEAAGQKILYRPAVAVEHHFDPDRLSMTAFLSSARRMAASRAIVIARRDPPPQRPTSYELLSQVLPGLAFRAITQGGRLLFARQPDAGFLLFYYRFRLWLELRARTSPRKLISRRAGRGR
jgi:glycosyltransferase involved in cell wall biosynthesis